VNDHEIRRWIDACRPGRDDLADGEFADLADAVKRDPEIRRQYEKSRQFDAALARAIDAVEVPAGLAERLNAAVLASCDAKSIGPHQALVDEAASRAGPAAAANAPVPSTAAALAEVPFARRRFRRFTWIGAALAIALLLAAGGVLWIQAHGRVDGTRLVAQALAWKDAHWHAHDAWQPLPGVPAPEGFSVAPFARRQPRAWQAVDGEFAARTVVFDLSSRGTRRTALLFVVETRGTPEGLPPAPPATPHAETGNWQVAAWHHAGLVYVLVFLDQPENRYSNLVRLAPQA
jgi:hypothetical protein